MKAKKVSIASEVRRNGAAGIMQALLVLQELFKLPIMRFYDDVPTREYPFGEWHPLQVDQFSTCRAQGFVVTNEGNDVAIAVSESAGSDDIRLLVGTRADFDLRLEQKGLKRNPNRYFEGSQGYHSYAGPKNDKMWEKAIYIPYGQYKRAAIKMAELLSDPKGHAKVQKATKKLMESKS